VLAMTFRIEGPGRLGASVFDFDKDEYIVNGSFDGVEVRFLGSLVVKKDCYHAGLLSVISQRAGQRLQTKNQTAILH